MTFYENLRYLSKYHPLGVCVKVIVRNDKQTNKHRNKQTNKHRDKQHLQGIIAINTVVLRAENWFKAGDSAMRAARTSAILLSKLVMSLTYNLINVQNTELWEIVF